VFETSCPVANRRKLRVFRELNVDLGAAAGALNDHPKLVTCGFSLSNPDCPFLISKTN
jgi:hypothetical protein